MLDSREQEQEGRAIDDPSLLALAGALLILGILVVPTRVRLWAYTVVAFVTPVVGVLGIAISTLWGSVTGLASIREVLRSSIRGTLLIAVFIAGVQLIATLWSPDPLLAVNAGIQTLLFVLAAVLGTSLLNTGPKSSLLNVVLAAGPFIAVQAVTMVVFRVSPALEETYYQSGVSRLLLGATGSNLYLGGVDANNVLDPERSGGILFVNSNRASMVMGICLLVYLALWCLFRSKVALVLSVLLIGAIAASGSKTGLALLVLLPLFALVLSKTGGRVSPGRLVLTVGGSLIVVVVGLQLFLSYGGDFISASEETLVPRYALWGEALRALSESPFLGLGYGGWFERWQAGGVDLYFERLPRPSHNVVLTSWLDAGILLPLAALALGASILGTTISALRKGVAGRDQFGIALLFTTFVWVAVHGMGDNTDIFGTSQTIPLLGIAFAFISHHASGAAQSALEEPTSSSMLPTRDAAIWRASR